MLLDWLREPTSSGIHVAGDDGRWAFTPYTELALGVRRFGAGLRARGVPPGGVVALATAAPDRFIVAFMGALAAGAVPCPVPAPPPAPRQRTARHRAHLARAFCVAKPSAVAADPAFHASAAHAADEAGLEAVLMSTDPDPAVAPLADACEPDPEDTALMQIAAPRGADPVATRVTWGELQERTAALRDWMNYGPGGVLASWLPVYHDISVLGAVIGPVVSGSAMWIMTPDRFARFDGRLPEHDGEPAALSSAP